jgi:hypothetical protein
MFINQVLGEKIVINCKTIEEAARIVGLANQVGCSWSNGFSNEVYWPYKENTCYRLSNSLTYADVEYFENYQIVDSIEISDDVWVNECDQEGLYWVTMDFEDIFYVYEDKISLNEYWYLPIPNSKKPIIRKPVSLSFKCFKKKLYTRDGLPIDVNHYACYNDRVQVVDINGKVFDGPFYE